MYACVCVPMWVFVNRECAGTHRGQETELYPRELQWQLLLAANTGTGNWAWVFISATEPSLQAPLSKSLRDPKHMAL